MQQAGIGAGYIKNIINDRVVVVPQAHRRHAASSRSSWWSASCSIRTASRPGSRASSRSSTRSAADRGADGRGGDPRARARHARAPAGHAADRVRDRDGQGVGQQPGDPGRDRRVAVPGRADGAEGAVRRLRACCGSSGVVLYLFFATALGIFLGTISRSMAQFALLIILVIVVLMLLSGGSTPVESQPKWLQYITYPPARAPLRQLLAGDHLSRRRPAGGLATVPDGRRGRPRLLRLQPVARSASRSRSANRRAVANQPAPSLRFPGRPPTWKVGVHHERCPCDSGRPLVQRRRGVHARRLAAHRPDLGRPARARQPGPRSRAVGKTPGPGLRLRAHPGRAHVPEARELHPPPGQAHGRATADGSDQAAAGRDRSARRPRPRHRRLQDRQRGRHRAAARTPLLLRMFSPHPGRVRRSNPSARPRSPSCARSTSCTRTPRGSRSRSATARAAGR